ncbi:glucan-binding YG repeat protein [Hungatella effluvii]|uniref:Glucan-binding YG repeat protein n=1 Tax=Hungatella effluvii TaxID=1096246 RepID=A0A2V3YPX2_9FIRM|nr:cell wall-binding protein [Hungatella effluvii]PXX56114.1 glucan-binding YG repeat protein [Hungatella effluvii]
MKKKGFVVLAVAAVLTLGTATMSAWAAEGWAQSGNSWSYYDSNGYKVTNVWKKGADNLWRYLNGNGEMAVNTWVDNTYYMDSNGILVTDKWMKFQESGSSEYKWYYFGSSGKAIMDNWSKINNKWYYFDSNGEMQTGWVLDNMYYCGTDGVMRTGWQKLFPPDSDYDPDRVSPGDEDDDGKHWYYFSDSGKKYMPKETSGDYGTYKIDGVAYCFDSDGALQTGWKNVGVDNADYDIQNYKYYDSSGKLRTGWYSIEPPEDLSGYEGDVEWFYFSSNGTPKAGPKEGEATTQNLTKINGKTYLFNDRGNPVYGLQKVRIGSTSEYTSYYFGDKKTSTMQKGKIKVTEGDGDEETYYFSDSGRGYTGVKDGYLYYMGKLQRAEDGVRYEPITIPAGNSYTTYVVNASGKVAKNTTVKNADGVKYKTSSSGSLIKVDDEGASGSYRDPIEPVWKE